MHNGFVLNILRAVAVAAIVATGTALWQLTKQEAVLEEQVRQLLIHSDKRDDILDRRLDQIERQIRIK